MPVVDAISITESQAGAAGCAIPSRWEGDLFYGATNRDLAIFVERLLRYFHLERVMNKSTVEIGSAFIREVRRPPVP